MGDLNDGVSKVAHTVGREPVNYVANIYKYYLAYTLLAEEEARKAALEPERR